MACACSVYRIFIMVPYLQIQDVVTRWNSTLDMMERLLQHRSSIDVFFKDRTVKSLSESEWLKLKTLSDLLRPLKTATNTLGGNKYVTISIVLPYLAQLIHAYEKDDDDPVYVGKFKKTMVDRLEASRKTLTANMFVKAATVLDPRFKKLKCIPKESRDEVWDHLVSLLKLSLQESKGEGDVTAASATKKRSYESSDEENDGEDTHTTTSLQTAKQAINSYRAVPQVTADSFDPLKWWQVNQGQHPLLIRLVKKHLCCPGTSVPSERLFSKAGHVISTKRASLLPENANTLVCLSS